MDKGFKSTALKFIVLDPIYWNVLATLGAFISAYALYSKGYAQSSISLLIALYYLCAFIGQFALGGLCDMLQSNKFVFMACVTGAWAAGLGVFFSPNIAVFAVCYGLFGFMFVPAGSILDSWMLKVLNYNSDIYSKARAAGSAGYAVVVALMGTAIATLGYGIMPICSAVMAALTLAIAFTIPDVPKIAGDKSKRGFPLSPKNMAQLFKCKPFMFMLLIELLIGLGNSPIGNLKIMLLQSVGGGVSWQGIDSGVGCAVQFLCFMVAGRLNFIELEKRLYFFLLLPIVMILIDIFAVTPVMVVIGTCITYGSYSFFLPATRQLVGKYVDPALQTTANSMADAAWGSLCGVISLLYAGSIIQYCGTGVMLRVSLGFMLAGLVLVIFYFLRRRKTV